jgi:sugar lactone lactonase YvrE
MKTRINEVLTRSRFTPVLFALTLAALTTWATPLTAADTLADRVIGQSNFYSVGCNFPGRSASTLCLPTSVKVDAVGDLYVADRGNNRVLIFRSPLTTDLVPDMVIGQPDFFSGVANNEGLSASSLNFPTDIAVDAAGNLYVADSNNNRVLEYDTPLTTDAVADRVFGQPDFTTGTPNTGGLSASSLWLPSGVAVDSSGNLYVGEFANNRVVVYENALSSDAIADHVFGQPDFTTNTFNTGGLSASSLAIVQYVFVSADGTLFVDDLGNDRVLAYFSPLTSDPIADRVFGKPDFTTPPDEVENPPGVFSCATPTATSLCDNRGLAVDNAGNLFVADGGISYNNPSSRVVVYGNALNSDNVADQVFGQPDFTSFGCQDGPNGLCKPRGVAVDAAGNLYVADWNNNRVLEYDAPPLVHDGDGDGVPDPQDACPTQNPGGLDADHNGCIDTLPGLRGIVSGLNINQTVKNGLLSKLDEAQKALNHGDKHTAINKLRDFISQVNAKRGTAISNTDADLLVAYANNVIITLT